MTRKGFILLCMIGLFEMGGAFAQGFTQLTGTLLPVAGNSKISAGDFNNDGLMDLIIAGKDNTKSFAKVLQNNGDSSFFDLGLGLPSLTGYAIELSDLNNDSWLDIIMSGVNAANKPEFHIFINQKNGTFQSISHTIPGLRYGHIECKDLNLDGYSDIFVMGLSETGNYTAIHKNNGDLTFSKVSFLFQGAYDGGAVLVDINNDGLSDIFYSGLNSSFIPKSYLFLNKGDFDFNERTSDITGIRSGNIDAADMNNDGFTDIAVFGNDENNNYVLKVYKNNLGSSFTLHSDLQGIVDGSIQFGDFNADGYSDLLTSGKTQSGVFKTTLFSNNAGLSFMDSGILLTGLNNSACQYLDFNNDHKLDLVISGYKLAGPTVELHSNCELQINHIPDVPQGLISKVDSNQVSLKWNNSLDIDQNKKGLSYNFWMKNEIIGKFVFAPSSDTSSGKRRLVQQGLFEDTSCIIKNIPEGKYSWSVQSVDASFEASDFSSFKLFYIAEPIDLGNDTSICYGDSLSFSFPALSGTVKWYHSLNPVAPFSTSKEIRIQITQKDTIWIEVTKSFGAMVYDTIIVDIRPLPSVDLKNEYSLCYADSLKLSLGSISDIVNWQTLSGIYTETDNNVFGYPMFTNDKIYATITDSYGCTNFDTTNISVLPLSNIELVNDTTLCLNSNLYLNLGTTADSINWYSLSSSFKLLNSNIFEHIVSENNTFKIEWYNQNRCVNYDTIQVKAHNLPVADAGNDKLVCSGYITTIGPEIMVSEWNYSWTGVGLLAGENTVNPTVQVSTESKYILTVSDQYQCEGTDSMLVKINPVGILNAGINHEICVGHMATLGGNPTANGSILPYSYLWSPASSLNDISVANPVASPLETTTYSLIIYTGDCPVDTLETTVTVNPLPIIEIMNDTIAGFKEDIQLWARGGVIYQWYPGEFLDNPMSQNPITNLEKTTRFIVEIEDENGCADTAGLAIFIKNEIFIPELFTPNQDGNNDVFMVYGFGIRELQLLIFNKYGNVVFESNNLNEILTVGWNGEDRGFQVEEGKYFWKIIGEFYNGEKVLFNGKDTGVITVLR